MKPLHSPSLVLAGLLLGFSLVASGCAESVEPVVDVGKPFTLYGVLDPTTDEQALRVVPYALSLDPPAPGPLDARVTATDLGTGEVVEWTDSLVAFEGGGVGHVFLAAFQPIYNHTYRIEAERSDGASTWADVTIPPLVEPVPQEPAVSASEVVLSVLWPATPQTNGAYVAFDAVTRQCEAFTVRLPFQPGVRPFEFGWLVEIPFLALSEQFFAAASEYTDSRVIALTDLRMSVLISSGDWYPPGGVYDPEVLVDPNTFTNVENGFGFVGGGYRVEASVVPGFAEIRRAGFEGRGFGEC